jgi:hypothetical protein
MPPARLEGWVAVLEPTPLHHPQKAGKQVQMSFNQIFSLDWIKYLPRRSWLNNPHS